ncbi:MAG: sulfite exporter TauE/SafE family protein [Ardenticatenaceae bacterium]|nr:sulfite exporter TauE/SafE family protein [Ardenticatenaceae bacterium]
MTIAAITFLAIFTQSVSGFGLGLVAISLLANVMGIRAASPLVSLIGITAQFTILLYYRRDFNLRAVARLAATAILGIPIGLYFLRQVDSGIVTAVLGLVLISYSLYTLIGFKMPRLDHPLWAYSLGFVSGMLGGAYNTSGPPVIIYGACQEWPRAEFKSNLQGYFLLVSSTSAVGHALSGNITSTVWHNYLFALPAIALGIIIGVSLDKRINPHYFRQLVLIMLIILGLRLIVA